MDTLRRDFVYALRTLLRKPGFTGIAVITLALGIAANTAIFSLINGVLLRPLPYPHAERLVNLWAAYPESHGQHDIFSPGNFLDVEAHAQTLEAAGAYTDASFTLAGAGTPEFFPGIRMTASTARVLGVAPQMGRWFTREEDESGQAMTVLSDSLWRNRFGADPGILGRTVQLNGRAFTVIGVMPPGVGYPSLQTQVYAPISFTAEERTSRGSVEYNAIARLRPGVSVGQARAELATLAAAMAKGYQMGAESLQDSLVGNVREMLIVLWAAVAFMLAVGCANVANLLLTRAAARQREFALRRSLGATNGRLIRQLLTESVVLALGGGLAGLALAAAALPAMAAQLPAGFPRVREIGLDGQVLWFTFGISILTGVLFGIAPAASSARRNLAQALREGGDRGGSGHQRIGRLLVVAEIAAVLVLMVGSGLVLRSLVRLSSVDPGFRARGLAAWQIFLPPARYPDGNAQRAFYSAVLEQVRSLPGVQSAAFVQPMPFGPVDIVNDGGFAIGGRPIPTPDQMPQALVARASPDYFSAMKIPVERGRVFTARDSEGGPPVVVISETLARRYFTGQEAVGQHLLLGGGRLAVEIVGVVGDVKHNNLRNAIRPEVYLPMMHPRIIRGNAGLVVRTAGDAGALLPALQRRVWAVDNTIAANMSGPVDRFVYASLAPARVATLLLGVFAAITLLLGLVGVYGVLSYAVNQRTREIGIRLALGAAPSGVLRMVLREALGMSIAGVALGVALAFPLARYLHSLLFGVSGADPLTYAAASAGVLGAALLAAYSPARRATRIDPALSLRGE